MHHTFGKTTTRTNTKAVVVSTDLLVSNNFTVLSDISWACLEAHIQNNKSFLLLTWFVRSKPIDNLSNMTLSTDAMRLATVANAGGSSVHSEVLSFEIFKSLYNAQLISTEMETCYFPEGGSMVDYVMRLFEFDIGVSVTRAMKYDDSEFTSVDALDLLSRKLSKINQSRRNVINKWDRQLIHIWTNHEYIKNIIIAAWFDLNQTSCANLAITLADQNCGQIFFNSYF